MIALLILASLAFLFFIFLAVQVWWRYRQPGELTHGFTLTPVDLDAFQNLTDPDEEEFLRLHLAPADFRVVQRLRIRAAKRYVSALSRNSRTLMAVGQAARFHPDSTIAVSGQQLVQRAIRLSIWCMLVELRLNTALAVPTLVSPSGTVVSHYLAVKGLATSLNGKLAS